ncbi:MAG: hypothetical protein LLG00_12185 [Planctomycetaceae bacterium]|nr:hypothetical protein [Planctomycetaceae bacterium]
MKAPTLLIGIAALLWGFGSSDAVGQRVQFPTQVAEPNPSVATPPIGAAPPGYTAPAGASPYGTGAVATPPAAPGTWAAPAAAPGGVVAAPVAPPPSAMAAPSLAPTYAAPGAAPAVPGAAVNGAIPAPPANWDPYATPSGPSGTLLQQDPYVQPGACGQFSMGTVQKFIQHVDLDFDWFAGNGDHELGIDDVNLDVTFAFPMFFNSNTPLLVTPGFAVHYWSGPQSLPPTPPDFDAPADMPARTYDAYLDFAWNPKVNEFFGGELNFRTGVYSDFYSVTTKSIRFTGKGMAVLRFSPSMTVKAGIWYLDRVNVKMLPAGGLVWTPNPDVCFDILFPNPKISKRLTTWGCTEWWGYLRGEYGGGVWTVRRNTEFYDGTLFPVLNSDLTEYDDIRIAAGLDFKTVRQMKGYVEVGLSCSRELSYKSGLPSKFYPHNTVFVGAGLSY